MTGITVLDWKTCNSHIWFNYRLGDTELNVSFTDTSTKNLNAIIRAAPISLGHVGDSVYYDNECKWTLFLQLCKSWGKIRADVLLWYFL